MDILIIGIIVVIVVIIVGCLGGLTNFFAVTLGRLFKSAISFIMGSILILFIIGSCIGGCPNNNKVKQETNGR